MSAGACRSTTQSADDGMAAMRYIVSGGADQKRTGRLGALAAGGDFGGDFWRILTRRPAPATVSRPNWATKARLGAKGGALQQWLHGVPSTVSECAWLGTFCPLHDMEEQCLA